MGRVAVLLLVLFSMACSQKTKSLSEIKVYSGPLLTAENITTLYSDSAQLVVKLIAPLQLEYADGNRDFPKGIQLDFYDDFGVLSSRLTCNRARYDKALGIYVATGNVIIVGYKDNKKLNSEELRWNRIEKKVYTDKFVRVESPTEISTGYGFTASQDFQYYRILKPEGTSFKGSENGIL